jgi:energy-converting hydrogenase Eha subunit E
MSEHINLRGVVSKPWIGSSELFRWMGYVLIAMGLFGSLGGLLPMVDGPFIRSLLPINWGLAAVVGGVLLALAHVLALINEIFDANHAIID